MFLLSSRPWSGPDLAEVDAAVDAGEAEVSAMVEVEVEGDTCLVVEVEVATDEVEEASAEAAVAVDSKSPCIPRRRNILELTSPNIILITQII
jgi:hypothetical protein